MQTFQSPLGDFQLRRQPPAADSTLRAWDAADELLLQHLHEHVPMASDTEILLVNDQFGALACALHGANISVYSDSYLTQQAVADNYTLNQLGPPPAFIPSTERPSRAADLILIKIPRTLALLEHQLIALRAVITSDTRVIAAGMVKYLHRSHVELLQRLGGAVTTSLAKKKARLLFVQWCESTPVTSPYPDSYREPITGLTLSNDANLFSRTRPDPGSRLILENLSALPSASRIADMGCGNGILGIAAQREMQQRGVADISATFVDESFMALNSARHNVETAFGLAQNNRFCAGDGFSQCESGTFDLVLCNPPFHQANTVGDHIAWSMITGSRRCLMAGGVLWLVGNRHLHYQAKLKKVFGGARVVASNPKFVVLEAVRR